MLLGGGGGWKKNWTVNRSIFFEEKTSIFFPWAISLIHTNKSDMLLHRITMLFFYFFVFFWGNSRWFRDSAMILFLNKRDIFERRIKEVPLNVCPDFEDLDPEKSHDYKYGIHFLSKCLIFLLLQLFVKSQILCKISS